MLPADLWAFLPAGYALTVAIETPVLLLGLSRAHGPWRRLGAGLWLTACTYPLVVLVLPVVIPAAAGRALYLAAAETAAPALECLLFALAFHRGEPDRRARLRDFAAIVAANLLSFGIGEWLHALAWL
jgi:hypothetical protein